MLGVRALLRVMVACVPPLALSLTAPRSAEAEETDPYAKYRVLRINEVVTKNNTQKPADGAGKYRDMVEIYNGGETTLALGSSNDNDSCALSGTGSPTPIDLWFFPGGGYANIPGKGFLVVFLDQQSADNPEFCQLYAGFSLKSDGSEPITLWGPALKDGQGNVIKDGEGNPIRKKLDEVWLPPLRDDYSFGRYPDDGSGPAHDDYDLENLPGPEVYEYFKVYQPGETSFGSCAKCPIGIVPTGVCSGAPNVEGTPFNLRPSVERTGHSTNRPATGEGVELRVRVRDDKEPTPGNIEKVLLHYWVDGTPQPDVEMTYDSARGLVSGKELTPPRPLDFWTEWTGTIPGQAKKGARVQFTLEVTDVEGLKDVSPGVPSDNPGCADGTSVIPCLCPEGMGPCDRDFGGPNCELDPDDVTCTTQENPSGIKGKRYVTCNVPFSYLVGYEIRGNLSIVVINEVVPRQQGILVDETERNNDQSCAGVTRCELELAFCCSEDFLELNNSSSTDAADLSGLWLSDSPFHPRGWQFPQGSSIGPGEHLIVWLDNDGGKCPDPAASSKPCFWECPDPTYPATKEFHTSFSLDADKDQIYLFDTEENGYGVIHGVEFAGIGLNQSWALVPDGDRSGSWRTADPTPRAPNAPCSASDPVFLRGDSNGDCRVDITDAIFALNFLFMGGDPILCMDAADGDDSGVVLITDAVYVLNFLFNGGPEPLSPGAYAPGCDPTPDQLEVQFGACQETCRSQR